MVRNPLVAACAVLLLTVAPAAAGAPGETNQVIAIRLRGLGRVKSAWRIRLTAGA